MRSQVADTASWRELNSHITKEQCKTFNSSSLPALWIGNRLNCFLEAFGVAVGRTLGFFITGTVGSSASGTISGLCEFEYFDEPHISG